MKILFMCVANSARSQLAEALAKQIFAEKAAIYSAGSRPTKVNPFAVRALQEVGADWQALYSKKVDDLPQQVVDQLDYVITLCAEEVCPIIIVKAKKLHWPLPDPASSDGSDEEQMVRFRHTRNEICKLLEKFANDLC